ncbi:hypothetical protein ACQ86N_09290 [Puia sp. P3]|uniref:hypothetical protein n=1 Tax=Puia sp. P3 TaxID=3423952 RepID=UPI003D667827
MEYGNRVQSHGKEWKSVYRKMLEEFLRLSIFPSDILDALKKNLHDLPASSCADEGLMRVLRRYDENTGELLLVEQIPEGAVSVWRITGCSGKEKIEKKIPMYGSSHGKIVSFQSNLRSETCLVGILPLISPRCLT